MSKLLRFEFHKLFRQKSFYICTALLLAINLYTIIYAYLNDGRGTGLICMATAVCSTDFTMLFGIFTALFTCDDYANGTVRNILSRGFTRTQVYFSKLITVIVAAVIAVLLVWAATFTAGTLCWRDGLGDFNSTVLSTLEAQLLLTVAAAALFYAISSVIAKTGASVAVCLLIDLIAALGIGIYSMLFEPDLSIAEYWISNLRGSCCGLFCDYETLSTSFIAALCYFFGSTALGYLAVCKREY